MTTALMLMVSVVLFNHMGLSEAIEKVTHYKFRIMSCSKCGTFWAVLIYQLVTETNIVASVTAAFALSYTAIWFELLLGYLSYLYETAYDKIQTAPSSEDEANAKS